MSAPDDVRNPLGPKYLLAGAHPFGRRRGRILGISPHYFRSTRVHPTLSPQRFSLELAKASPANNFEETHLAEVLDIIAGTDILSYLKPWQVMILKSVIRDCKGNNAEIKLFLLTWFDIFNSAFFGGSLRILRSRLRLTQSPAFKALGAFGFGPFPRSTKRGSKGFFLIKKKQKDLDSDNPNTTEEMYIGTLIHEMVHAFLDYHMCECKTCRLRHLDPQQGGAGLGGHGPSWADSLLPIALALQDQVKWQVDTGINNSVEIDMEKYNWVCTPEQAKKWGVNQGDDFIQRLSQKRRRRAQRASNRPPPGKWHQQSRHEDIDAANEQLIREVLLENENETP